ncbi:MAG: hypothetical protein AAGD14_09725 [Planctomycetota bacterium]
MRILEPHHLAGGATSEARVARAALRASIEIVILVGTSGPAWSARKPRLRVDQPDELRPDWLRGRGTVGIVARPRDLALVRRALERMP